ncbi:MAG TPA: ABC transporter ATP-binding protein [Parachlamydiaceae bacterium]|nr:ABC transporter ATP-binding protein [Parachlamydiaceae bacterium]
MRKLFKIAFKNRKNRLMLFLTAVAMCLLTVASQLEILAIGVITQKGPELFDVLGQKGQDLIEKERLQLKFAEIDKENKGFITKQDVTNYLTERKSGGTIDKLMLKVSQILPLSGNVKSLAIMLIAVAVFKSLSLFLHRFTTRLVAIRVSQALRQNYFEHIQSLPMSFFQQYNIGSLSSRAVGDASQIAESINACLVNYLQTPFTVISTLILCFITSWQLSLIIFLGFPLIVFPIAFLTKGVKRISKQLQQNQEKFASVLIDFLAGIQTVKVFAMEDFSLKKYREQNEKMASLEKKSARYDLSTSPIVHIIGMCFLATALLYGLYVLQMTLPELFFYCGMLYFFYMPIKKFAEENAHIQRGIAAAERMFEVLDLKPDIQDRQDAKEFLAFQKEIQFEDVWFRYDNKWILKGLNFSIKKGQTVAIVGPTGAGKSTVVQLLPRLYNLEKGKILIDGKCITAFTQKSLRDQIAFIPQKPFLFLDTIFANISYGKNYSLDEIQTAAKKAHAEEFILDLPKGYDTELSETGKNLSGGQQQRLAIARALVKKAPILIMDEATSSLDNVSENKIKEAIKELKGEVTQVIIAHRLSTIEDADKIIYLEKGEKVAEGTKDELLETCEGFKNMWDMMHAPQAER